jgi:N utilization substance protein B
MGLRRQAREAGLQLLFAQEQQPLNEAALAEFWDSVEAPEKVHDYALMLTGAVSENQHDIDQVISRYAANWSLERMSRVDRNLLRLAVAEMFFVDDVPVRVTLDEAIEVAKAFGGEESSRFVNGILDRIAKEESDRVTGGDNLKAS